MSDIDLVKLEVVVSACRRGLESLSEARGSTFNRFPAGACGVASDIVGRIVWETLQRHGVYVCGTGHPLLPPQASHAWFEVDGVVIDITYDQFEGTGLSGWLFEPGEGWHAGFEEQERRDGYCSPRGWPMYPHDGYQAALKAVVAAGLAVTAD